MHIPNLNKMFFAGLAFSLLAAAALFAEQPAVTGNNLIANPSFEDGMSGWNALWSRDAGAIDVALASGNARTGSMGLGITHTGKADWSFTNAGMTATVPGERYAISGWVKTIKGKGSIQISVVTRDDNGETIEWLFGPAETSQSGEWKKLESGFVIPDGCASIQLRLTGYGAGSFSADDLSLVKTAAAPAKFVRPDKPVTIGRGGSFCAYDPKTDLLTAGKKGDPTPVTMRAWGSGIFPISLTSTAASMTFAFRPSSGEPCAGTITVDDTGAVRFSLAGSGALGEGLSFPGPVKGSADGAWVLPYNEGLLIPVNDAVFSAWRYNFYQGHGGLSMPFIGLTDADGGYLFVVESPDDCYAKYQKPKSAKQTSGWEFFWESQKGQWGYARKITLSFTGNTHTDIAKAYRVIAEKQGKVVTLRDKRKKNPSIDRLIGAANLWWWDNAAWWTRKMDCNDAVAMLKQAGLDRVLWSNMASPESVKFMNDNGYLTGRYDIYQDVWAPGTPFDFLNTEGWPDDLLFNADGKMRRGWVHRDSSGHEYPGGVICAPRATERMKKQVAADLAVTPYAARFIDTTTASPLMECYNPAHPVTRSGDREAKSAMLGWLSDNFKLVTGSETGMDWAVPYLSYFEGMMSLADYRLPDSGYDLTSYKKPDADYLAFQTGTAYRIPLFELVYHDCVASYWYWGDSSNRVPELWKAKDLLNILYGTGPLYIMDNANWKKYGARFVESYTSVSSVTRTIGYERMLSHEFLTADHSVQRTVWSNGTAITVNFGKQVWTAEDGQTVKAESALVTAK